MARSEHKRIFSNGRNAEETDEIKDLIKQKFMVDDNYDAKEALSKISKNFSVKEPSPELSYIMLTDSCNFRCKYCYIENALTKTGHSITMNLADKIIKVISNNATNVKEYRVIFYGGEPTMNQNVMKHIVESLTKIDSHKFKFGIVTNGSLMTDELAEYMKKHDFSIGLSVDGWYELDKSRVTVLDKGTFYDALKALSLLKKHNAKVSISCTVSKYNYLYLDEIVDFFHKLGVGGIGFNIILDSANSAYSVKDPKQLSHYMFKGFLRATELGMFEDRIGRRRAVPFFRETPKLYDCPAFGQQIFFSPRGTLGPCQAFYTTNLNQEQVTEDFNARRSDVMKEWIRMGGPFDSSHCAECPAIGICGGSCAYDVYTKTGKLGFIDPYFCEFMRGILIKLINYHYATRVKSVFVTELNSRYFEPFGRFVERLKSEKGLLMGVNEISDVNDWLGRSMMMLKSGKEVFNIAVDKRNGEAIGFCNIVRNRDRYEVGIAVDARFRRQGIAADMMEKTIGKAKGIGIKEVYALVDERNTSAISLLGKKGFTFENSKNNKRIYKKNI